MKFDDQLDIERAMIVFSHPDDAEWMAGGTVAAWAAAGVEVTYVLVTNAASGSKYTNASSKKLDPTLTREMLTEVRYVEQQAAADVLGVARVVHLGFEDGYVEPSLDLRKAVAREVRRYRPDVIMTQDPTYRTVETFYLNHPDHIAVGEVVLRTVNPDASSGLMFPELWHEEGFEPWEPQALFLGAFFEGDTMVDISATFERKLEALLKHESQIDDPEGLATFVRERFHEIGERAGCAYAEGFRRFTLRQI